MWHYTLRQLREKMEKAIPTHISPCEAFKAFRWYVMLLASLAGVVFLFTWGVNTGVGSYLFTKIEYLDARGIENKTNIATLTERLDGRMATMTTQMGELKSGLDDLKKLIHEARLQSAPSVRPSGAFIVPTDPPSSVAHSSYDFFSSP